MVSVEHRYRRRAMAFMEVAVAEEAPLAVHPLGEFTLEARVFMQERVAREEGLPVPTQVQVGYMVAAGVAGPVGARRRHITAATEHEVLFV